MGVRGSAGRSPAGAGRGVVLLICAKSPPAGCVGCVHQSAGRVRAAALPEHGGYVGLGFFPTSSCNARGRVCTGPLACKSSVLYIRLPCLQALGPLQEHTTFRESLVCYTSPPGGVYVFGVLPGVCIIRSAGRRGRSGFALSGAGRPAQSTEPDCPDSQASRARHSHTGFFRSCKAAEYRTVTIHRFQRLS